VTGVKSDVLSVRRLNRATLARQMLLERDALSPVAVIERLVGMQAQWPPSPYIGIWTRSTDFRRDELERELAAGNVVKATVMRQTLHLVIRRDYGVLRAALTGANHVHELPEAHRLAPHVRAFAADGPVTMSEALAHLEEVHGLTGQDARMAWRGARVRAHLVHHHETALWSARPEARFVAIDEPDVIDPLDARTGMVRRYFQAFGPASRADLRAWCMMRASELNPAIDRIEGLHPLRDDAGRELLDIEGAPLPDEDTPTPVRFLPKWDNVLLAFADRTRILPDEYKKIVIRNNGDVKQTFLVDGMVAGIWRFEGGRAVTEPFAPLSRPAQRELADEAERLEGFLSG
jgi:hypothetical protein